MSENLDVLLAELGRGTPFPVDWTKYEREVLRRLARREAARKRRAWWMAAWGACAGASAACVVMALWVGLRPAPIGAETAVAPHAPLQTAVQQKEQPAAVASAEEREARPCIRTTHGPDGVVGQIRFAGFSAPKEQGGGLIAAASRRGK